MSSSDCCPELLGTMLVGISLAEGSPAFCQTGLGTACVEPGFESRNARGLGLTTLNHSKRTSKNSKQSS